MLITTTTTAVVVGLGSVGDVVVDGVMRLIA